MLRNYIITAYRNLLRNKVFSFINILGLSIGMAACMFILQYVSFELSYDQFHKYAKDVYRVYLNIYKNGSLEAQSARVSPAVAAAFHTKFPSIVTYTRMVILGPDGVLSYKDRFAGESDILLADSSFFDVFTYHLIHGDQKTAFSEPFCVVITENTARKLFGDDDPVGESVVINAKNFDGTSFPFKVTGVIENFPENTHLHPGVLISYPTLFRFVGHRFDDSWSWNETYTYFRLRPGSDPKTLEAGFPEVVHSLRHHPAENKTEQEYKFQKITDIHLNSDLQHEVSVNGNVFYIYLLTGVSLLILLIAYINFVNLVTVKALQRAREVGIRKVSGAYRMQIILQFIIESLLVNGIAFFIAVILLQTATPYINLRFNVNLTFLPGNHPELWVGIAIFTLLLVLGSGFYPAFALSHYKPVTVLKGNIAKSRSGKSLRQSLVIMQFSMALILIIFTLTATRQVHFMQKQSLGFNPEQVLVIKAPKAYDYGYESNYSGFQHRISSLAHVRSVSGANAVPGQEIYWYDDQVTINGEQSSGVFSMLAVSPNYFSHYNIPLLSGRRFTDQSADQSRWIINESALELLGFENAGQAVGQRLNNGEIIGVVKDFHQESLKTSIPPILFNCGQVFNYYSIRLETRDLTRTMISIKEAYSGLFPGSPYDFFFLDEFFNRQYMADTRFNGLFGLFSGMAIFIAFLGLSGLTSYTATRRIKEIGIRKVLGAPVGSLVSLLSKDFIKLIFIAGMIALPIANFFIRKWLEHYAFRIEVGWWGLFTPLLMVLLISWLTVCIQTIKTALADPVKSLRYE